MTMTLEEKNKLLQANYEKLVLQYNILDRNYKDLCKTQEALAQPLTRDWKETIDERIAKDDMFKEAIAQPAQEPVAWLYKRENSSGGWYVVTNYEKENDNGTRNIECYDIPLYTHPAPAWQGLSDDEICELGITLSNPAGEFIGLSDWKVFARAIEQALKEKNAI